MGGTDQRPRRATILNYLGNDCLTVKEHDCARIMFERALALAGDGKNQRLVAYLLLNLGEIANATGDQTLAARHLDDATAASRRQNLLRGIADVHYLYARVERSRGRPEAALQHLDEGMIVVFAAIIHSPLGFALVSLEGSWLRVNDALC